MSVAYDFAPTVSVPARVRSVAPAVAGSPARAVARSVAGSAAGSVAGSAAPDAIPDYRPAPDRPGRLADVAVLHPPAPARPAVRLTRRGVVVLAVGVALLAGALVWLARLSAPHPAAHRPAVHSVVVQPGDTLWGIAARIAPGSDPQAEVDALMHRNHLTDPGQLRPGMQLRVP